MEEVNLREREVRVWREKVKPGERDRDRVCVCGGRGLDGECKESVCVV